MIPQATIMYGSANLYHTYTMYNPADICLDILNNIMSLYYLHYYQIFGLNGLRRSLRLSLHIGWKNIFLRGTDVNWWKSPIMHVSFNYIDDAW